MGADPQPRLLSLLSRRIAADWLTRYGYSPVLLETFVELERFTGACYGYDAIPNSWRECLACKDLSASLAHSLSEGKP